MAKKPPAEASTPLIFALVFFVLTTIAFGVLWYMQFSEQEANTTAVETAKKDVSAATALAKKEELYKKLYRVYLGVAEEDDLTTLIAEHQAGDDLAKELDRINLALAKKLGLADASSLPLNLRIWTTEDGKIPEAGPTQSIVETVAAAYTERDVAKTDAKKEADLYKQKTGDLAAAEQKTGLAEQKFKDEVAALPKQIKTQVDASTAKYEGHIQTFTKIASDYRAELTKLEDQHAAMDRANRRLQLQLTGIQEELTRQLAKVAKSQVNTFQYDAPQGKILGRPEQDVVEINLGSRDLVRPGLTFTVLPYDFQEKGRQSRMMVMRVPDERGQYQNVTRFMPKATIEVIEVIGPDLSRARVTDEYDRIRDGVAPGDLLYNSVWRKGVADHIALVGIFDINGDGADDIQDVIRDLTRMGIPVDAYFDMRERKWVGEITEQTRFVVEGFYPDNSALDPNRDDKTELLGKMHDAVEEARKKGVGPISFREFFPRMGYRVKLDVSTDRINQATAPYLNRVGAIENPPPRDGF